MIGLEDEVSGEVSADDEYHYDPYGDLLDTDPGDQQSAEEELSGEAQSNPFRFEGFYYDSGIESYDMQARQYRPDSGTFLSQDRFEAAGADLALQSDPLTQNRYAFAGGNPVSNVEFDGHCVVVDRCDHAAEHAQKGDDPYVVDNGETGETTCYENCSGTSSYATPATPEQQAAYESTPQGEPRPLPVEQPPAERAPLKTAVRVFEDGLGEGSQESKEQFALQYYHELIEGGSDRQLRRFNTILLAYDARPTCGVNGPIGICDDSIDESNNLTDAILLATGGEGKAAEAAGKKFFGQLRGILGRRGEGGVQDALDKAVTKVGTGSGPVYGTRVHSALKAIIDRTPGYRAEVSFLEGAEVATGRLGSIRVDVISYSRFGKPMAIYDAKTGSATLTDGRINAIRSELPEDLAQLPIKAIRPSAR